MDLLVELVMHGSRQWTFSFWRAGFYQLADVHSWSRCSPLTPWHDRRGIKDNFQESLIYAASMEVVVCSLDVTVYDASTLREAFDVTGYHITDYTL